MNSSPSRNAHQSRFSCLAISAPLFMARSCLASPSILNGWMVLSFSILQKHLLNSTMSNADQSFNATMNWVTPKDLWYSTNSFMYGISSGLQVKRTPSRHHSNLHIFIPLSAASDIGFSPSCSVHFTGTASMSPLHSLDQTQNENNRSPIYATALRWYAVLYSWLSYGILESIAQTLSKSHSQYFLNVLTFIHQMLIGAGKSDRFFHSSNSEHSLHPPMSFTTCSNASQEGFGWYTIVPVYTEQGVRTWLM